ncbi:MULTISPECIES: DUF3991 and toprim domain-containing protein [Clostridiaceae]|uniref:DUF3991 domain-containing protein n=1 Tax=Clostridium facile TaxID=2763035 RepID=A0ABR7IPJ9_9CLOT|nr:MULTISPECIES: DUF3991 and toprim domain-containing protein [Clostridiaceae]MBC5787057.1 DUF3991 domain-containing protein [Clostridium facile]
MAYLHFTEEQKERAKNTDIVELLRSSGINPKQVGSEYQWDDGSGKISIRNNLWFHQYERIGGDTVSFVRRFYHKSYPEAMQYILGQSASETPSCQLTMGKERKPFELPEKNPSMCRVYAYLIKQRWIEKDILSYFVRQNMIYEDTNHNAVFVGYDEHGQPRHAHKRGTHSAVNYKGNVSGSLAAYSFSHIGTSNRLYVFEAPIDLLSFLTIYQQGWQEHSYVALCSVAAQAALKIIKQNPNIHEAYLCLDHDKAGIEGCYRIKEQIQNESDCSVHFLQPEEYKDWNEQLKACHGISSLPAVDHPNQTMIESLCKSLHFDYQVMLNQYLHHPKLLLQYGCDSMEQMVEQLERLNPNYEKAVWERTLDMARFTLAFSIVRHRQFGIEELDHWYLERMASLYQPHKDNGSYSFRVNRMKSEMETITKEFKQESVLSQSEIKQQVDQVLKLGLDALCLGISIQNQSMKGEQEPCHQLRY